MCDTEASHLLDDEALATVESDGVKEATVDGTAKPPADACSEETVLAILKANSTLVQLLGGPRTTEWSIKECGDGNINFIFSVRNNHGASVIVKKVPPYCRVVGPSFPLSPIRMTFETGYFEMAEKCVELNPILMPQSPLPKIYMVDLDNGLFVMEDLRPAKVWRAELGTGEPERLRGLYPCVGRHTGYFLAQMLFKTSDMYLSLPQKSDLIAQFTGNVDLDALTEAFIFGNPYFEADNNRRKVSDDPLATLELTKAMIALRKDAAVRKNVFKLRRMFRYNLEALLHGDLHTGSLMVSEAKGSVMDDAKDASEHASADGRQHRTAVIDSEFARVGPMAFDIGQFVGNCVLAVFAQYIHETAGNCEAYAVELIGQIEDFWDTFFEEFKSLWKCNKLKVGATLFPEAMHTLGGSTFEEYIELYVCQLKTESLKFAAAVIIRRIIGLASIPDFEERPTDKGVPRLTVEADCLRLGHWLLCCQQSSPAKLIARLKQLHTTF